MSERELRAARAGLSDGDAESECERSSQTRWLLFVASVAELTPNVDSQFLIEF